MSILCLIYKRYYSIFENFPPNFLFQKTLLNCEMYIQNQEMQNHFIQLQKNDKIYFKRLLLARTRGILIHGFF